MQDKYKQEILLYLKEKQNFLNQLLDLSIQSKTLIEKRDDSLKILLAKRQKSMENIDIINEKIKSVLSKLSGTTFNIISSILFNKIYSDQSLKQDEKELYRVQNYNKNLLLQIIQVDNLMLLEINKVR